MHVDALVAVRSVDAEGDEGMAYIGASFNCARRIRPIEAENIFLIADLVGAAQFDELLRQVVVEGTGLVRHGDRDAKFVGVLSGRSRAVVDRNDGDDVLGDDRRSANAHLFCDRKEPMNVDRRLGLLVLKRLECGQHQRDAGFIVEVARYEETVLEKLRLWVD